MKGLLSTLKAAACGLAIAVLCSPLAASAAANNVCNDGQNDIIPGGASSIAALQHDYNHSACARAVYSAFNINSGDINAMGHDAVNGTVTKSGKVQVGGQTSAKGAVTAGRQNTAGSHKMTNNNATFYERTPQVSFQENSLSAFVVSQNGVFQFAILKSCGNPIMATAVKQPVKKVMHTKLVKKTVVHRTVVKRVVVKNVNNINNINTNVNVQTQSQQQSQSVNVETTPATPTKASTTATSTTPTSAVKQLVDTGPGGVVALFSVSAVAGSFGFRRYLRGRLV